MSLTEKQRPLEQSARLYGREALARALNINRPLLDSWIDGRAVMPHRTLLALASALVKLAEPPK